MIELPIEQENIAVSIRSNIVEVNSAKQVINRTQKVIILTGFLVFLAGLFAAPQITLIITVALLSLVYFADMIFTLTVVQKSLKHNSEIKFTTKELQALDESNLPTYTILCPLYKESSVLAGFVYAISELDWPKDKLEVLLLLEEEDWETRNAASALDLPSFMKTVIVPRSFPKTKPKACNHGLSLANGEYLVVYDAEDIPDRLQLKKAYSGFQKVSKNVKCLQAKLNFFNQEQNIITRLFTSEYSLWFDLMLVGLQEMKTYIPLGGTSNHFRTKDLKTLGGWDPFNVTEDCDLGARIFNQGFSTAIIDSTTYEEANSNLKNWIRQRSRWVKGYIQTYLVHTRTPIKFIRQHKLQAVYFHLTIGARAVFLLLNPIFWIMTISYFALHAQVGPAIESIYPAPVFYLAIITLVAGNFLHAYYYMLGCAKRSQWKLIKYVYLIPVYWFFGSVAALIALYQLVVKPHYWEKTNHGLSFENNFWSNSKFSPNLS